MLFRYPHCLTQALCIIVCVSGLLLGGCQPDHSSANSRALMDLVLVPGSTFEMGLEHPMMPEAGPVHEVSVNSFYISKFEVTNAEFARFVEATHYVTVAEQPLNPDDFPGADPALLVPGSVVFHSPGHPVSKRDPNQWWQYVPGANWRHPEGPDSDIRQRMDHPVVHIAWQDAVAYCQWAEVRLPTEAEWELAARGKLRGTEYTWGDELPANPSELANIFQGDFPHANSADDGYITTAPAGTFKPNTLGLYDMSGNVWEWVQDWYDPLAFTRHHNTRPVENPSGPEQPVNGVMFKVQKGGSFLCTDQYCGRFRPGARGRGDWQTSSNHVGFRVASDSN